MKILAFAAALAAVSASPALAQKAGTPVNIVAAENFYGDVAKQIGGPDVRVTSILSKPDQDPHLFEVSPSVGRAVSGARIVVYSGIDYDPWMKALLRAARSRERQVIVVARLTGRKDGDNPHIWYDSNTMLAYARDFAKTLTSIDPAHQAGYTRRLAAFDASMQTIQARIAALRHRLAGTPVIATEPVAGYLLDALGMRSLNRRFQDAVMNNTEPSAADVARFETGLKTRKVALLIYNSQASDPVASRMERLARASHIPVVGATETEPPGKSYQAWILGEIAAIDQALPKP